MPHGQVQLFWRNPRLHPEFQTGVSLHSHTNCSRESLEFIGPTAAKVPVLAQAVRRQETRYRALHGGRELDYSRGFWVPPLAAWEAYQLEQRQLAVGLGLRGLVSLTDHDTIEACHLVHVMGGTEALPVSVEWTIPRPAAGTYLHLGVHQLPLARADRWMAELQAWTARPDEARLAELLAALHADSQVLIVLNHPLWDEKGIGREAHGAEVRRFLDRYGRWLHALELNGFRPWPENREVIRLSEERGLVVISGGDRHGSEPNANINLSRAASFAEFVHEIRVERRSHVLFLPQYNLAKPVRVMHTLLDIFRDYPEHQQGRNRWTDRVFWTTDEGQARPLSYYWPEREPQVVRMFVRAVRLLENRRVAHGVRLALRRGEVQ